MLFWKKKEKASASITYTKEEIDSKLEYPLKQKERDSKNKSFSALQKCSKNFFRK